MADSGVNTISNSDPGHEDSFIDKYTCPEWYDTGPGGEAFRILCSDGHNIDIPDHIAVQIMAKCEYFRNVFRHGTKESRSRTVDLSDLDSTIAYTVIQYLLDETILIHDDVADGVTDMLNRLSFLHHGSGATLSVIRQFTGLRRNDKEISNVISSNMNKATEKVWTMSMKRLLPRNSWFNLFQRNIMLVEPPSSIIKLCRVYSPDDRERIEKAVYADQMQRGIQEQIYIVGVYTFPPYRSINPFLAIVGCIRSLRKLPKTYSSYRDHPISIELHLKQQYTDEDKAEKQAELSSITSCECILDYGLNLCHQDIKSSSCLTLAGDFQQLNHGLSMITDDQIVGDKSKSGTSPKHKRGILIVNRPCTRTISMLTKACNACTTHPGALGYHVCAMSVLAVKKIEDLRLMLNALSLLESESEVKLRSHANLTGLSSVQSVLVVAHNYILDCMYPAV
jgi:hypothetical protein